MGIMQQGKIEKRRMKEAHEKIFEQLQKDYKETEQWILFYYDRRDKYYEDSKYLHEQSNFLRSKMMGRFENQLHMERVVSLADLEHTEQWLLAVEMTMENIPKEKQVFIEIRRRAAQKNIYLKKIGRGRMNWVSFVQEHYAYEMAKKTGKEPETFWLSEKTIKIWWAEVVKMTRLIAMKKGCIA